MSTVLVYQNNDSKPQKAQSGTKTTSLGLQHLSQKTDLANIIQKPFTLENDKVGSISNTGATNLDVSDPQDQSTKNSYNDANTKSLTHQEATDILVHSITQTVRNAACTRPNSLQEYATRTDTVMMLIFALLLFAYFAVSKQTSKLVEGLFLLGLFALNAWLHVRESTLTYLEMARRVTSTVDMVRTLGISEKEDVRFPTSIPTVSITRVVRSGLVRLVPSSLLVENDIVLLAYGDNCPARARYIHGDGPAWTLARQQLFRPSFFTANPKIEALDHNNGLFYFRLLETPISTTIKVTLETKRPDTTATVQMRLYERWILTYGVWIVFACAGLINLLRLLLVINEADRKSSAFEMVFINQIYAIIPILPITLPSFVLIIRSYGNAQILALFEALHTSTNDFEDSEDVDEFDSCPAPTKVVTVSWNAIWRRFKQQMVHIDHGFLARTGGLVESLGNTTVLCAIDREGTIASPLPSVVQMMYFGEDGESILLDVDVDRNAPNGVRFEDAEWKQHLKVLKPAGLSFLMSNDCGVLSGRKRNDLHFKHHQISMCGSLSPARERIDLLIIVCLCHFGREMGFKKEALDKYTKKMIVHAFAPDKVFSVTSNTNLADEYRFEVPSMSCNIFCDPSNNYQAVSDGYVDLVVPSCIDYWNGNGLVEMNEGIEKRISEFKQNSLLADLDVIAISYRPIQTATASNMVQKMARTEPYYTDVTEFGVLKDDIELDVSNGEIRRRNTRSRVSSRIDTACTMDQSDFLRNVTKGHTLLGLASFQYSPKPNVTDFIEDLALAGIRFTYFSTAPERESKAYAEILGLEIDWNSCIILSPDDGTGTGYHAIQDMKSKLPRGVETIRHHLENVDDVPLRVSLFAECTPDSTIEMIKILQENGEVVCCIGSSLNPHNVPIFALADVSIAVDPLHLMRHKSPQVGALSPLLVAAGFNSAPCSLSLHLDSSLYNITQIIREARILAHNGRQSFSFYIGVQLGICFVQLLSYCFLFPPILEGYMLIFLLWVITPVLSFSLLFTVHGSEVMTHLPVKNRDLEQDAFRFGIYYLLRFCILNTIICMSLFWIILYSVDVNGNGITSWQGVLNNSQRENLRLAQTYMFIVISVYNIVISGTYLTRDPILIRTPFSNKVWIAAASYGIVCTFAFASLIIYSTSMSISMIPFYTHVIAIGGIPALVLIQETVKKHDKANWQLFQKRASLEFNTKLGMHSPL